MPAISRDRLTRRLSSRPWWKEAQTRQEPRRMCLHTLGTIGAGPALVDQGWEGQAWEDQGWEGLGWEDLAWVDQAWEGLGWVDLAWVDLGWEDLAWVD